MVTIITTTIRMGLRIPSIHTITAARAISRQNMQMKET